MQIKPNDHPAQVFKTLANWEALQEYHTQDMQAKCKPLPKYTKEKPLKKSIGWWNFTKTVLSELRP
jgi:hypothetical protein